MSNPTFDLSAGFEQFQFQYGTIMRKNESIEDSIIDYFNSSMVRLWEPLVTAEGFATTISIPVWYDYEFQ